MFDEKIKNQLTEILLKVKSNVNFIHFTQEMECGSCNDTHIFIKEITSLNQKLNLKTYDYIKDRETAEKYSIKMIPAIAILDKDMNDTGVRYYGIPGGYEINSFIESIIEISGNKQNLPADITDMINKIDYPVDIQIFVSLSCPHCADAVHTSNRLAQENLIITSSMIDVSVFPHLAVKHNISSVPKTVINGKHEFVGAQSMPDLVNFIGQNK